MLDFTAPAVRIDQITKLVRKTKGQHPVLVAARQAVHSFLTNGTNPSLYGYARTAQTAAEETRYDSNSGKSVPRITDKDVLAELSAVSLLASIAGPSWANGSSPETFRDTLNEACVLIDSTSYNERPY